MSEERVVTGRLVAGSKPPYTTWTFVEIAAEELEGFAPGRSVAVAVVLGGTTFHGTLTRDGGGPKSAGGPWRVAVTQEVLAPLGLARGDTVQVALRREARPEPEVPGELSEALEGDAEAAGLFGRMAPSMRRAWVEYVAEAKRAETRAARAQRAIAGIKGKEWPR